MRTHRREFLFYSSKVDTEQQHESNPPPEHPPSAFSEPSLQPPILPFESPILHLESTILPLELVDTPHQSPILPLELVDTPLKLVDTL